MWFEPFGFAALFVRIVNKFATINYEFFNQIGLGSIGKIKVAQMKNPTCPNCEKAIQHRHTFMATLPLTLVCSGCGSWVRLDVKQGGNFVVLGFGLMTLALAYFSAYFLILLPLYLVLSMGPLQNFSVELIKKRKAELWTINRRTGHLRPVNEAEEDVERDAAVSGKLASMQPFRSIAAAKKYHRKMHADGSKHSHKTGVKAALAASMERRKLNLDDLPTGLPN